MKIDFEEILSPHRPVGEKCPFCAGSMELTSSAHRDAPDGQGGDYFLVCLEGCKKCKIYKHDNMDGRHAHGIDISYDSIGFNRDGKVRSSASTAKSD